jgi:pimeloyl-ACP methyl ester carboxylesterase
MQRASQKIVAFVLIAFLAISPLRIDFFYLSQNVAAEEAPALEDWNITENTTWNKDTDLSGYENIYVEEGVTLTIEKGAQLAFRHLYIYGTIQAIGTMEEKIKLSGIPPVWDESTLYDPACFVEPTGTIEFAGLGDSADDPESILEFVEFSHLGGYYPYDTDNCPGLGMNHKIKDYFLPTAYAAPAEKILPAVMVYSGKVRMKNCIFDSNAYADIKVEIEYGEWNAQSYVHVENSNFQHNSQNTAVISSVTQPDAYNSLFEDCFNECKSDYPDDYNVYGEICGTTCTSQVESDSSWHDKTKVVLTNNWYGDASGPKIGDVGAGESITGDYTLDGWSNEEFYNTVVVSDASNVLFMPGLEASRLYNDAGSICGEDKSDGKRVWEPACNNDVRGLYLNVQGKSLNNIYTKENDVLDETPVGSNIYKSFIDAMDKLKDNDKVINDWKAFAYDWRLSYADILNDGGVERSLRMLAESSKTGRVTIVAHSNGGLLTKALMKKLGDEEVKKLVDKIIFVAVPQVGTPDAAAAILHGYEQGIFPVLNTETARGLAENMSGAYNLLPSEEYFSTVQAPIINFNPGKSLLWKDRYMNSISSRDKMDDFMRDYFWRVPSINSDTDTPSKANESLLGISKNIHNDLDNWTAPEGIKIIQIAGWGVPKTVSGIDYSIENREFCDGMICVKNAELLDPDFQFTIDGDGTVVTPSALWMDGVERYWVDLDAYNIFLVRHNVHKDILEIPNLLSFIEDKIENKTKDISDYTYLSTEVPSDSNKDRLQYSLHSPLTLNLYDAQGTHTGIDKSGEVEEHIPGTYYQQLGEVKYIFSREGLSQHIVMDGYGNGTFTFSVDELQGDKLLNKITFKDLPTTSKTKVTLDIVSNLASASKMSIDEDGDGAYDYEIAPILNGIVTSSDLIRIEKGVQNDDDDDGGGDHSHKKKKTTQAAATIKITPRASIGAKLADAFIIPKTNAYIAIKNDAVDKKENRWENRMSDEENKDSIKKEILISLIILLLIIIFGFRRWGDKVLKVV